MNDVELREQFEQWAAPLRASSPPAVAAIRRRARHRSARIAGATVVGPGRSRGGRHRRRRRGRRRSRHPGAVGPSLHSGARPPTRRRQVSRTCSSTSRPQPAEIMDVATGNGRRPRAAARPSRHVHRAQPLPSDDRLFVLGLAGPTLVELDLCRHPHRPRPAPSTSAASCRASRYSAALRSTA